ncbi:hypothetical protein VVNSV5830_00292 [Vibrio vulnificus]|nr:hypothetical protein VVORL1506_03394 [Vibrio vulnificus]OJI29904.1 hypothetical protein VVNSV5830_00292 [Vibrio vulnificus]
MTIFLTNSAILLGNSLAQASARLLFGLLTLSKEFAVFKQVA